MIIISLFRELYIIINILFLLARLSHVNLKVIFKLPFQVYYEMTYTFREILKTLPVYMNTFTEMYKENEQKNLRIYDSPIVPINVTRS